VPIEALAALAAPALVPWLPSAPALCRNRSLADVHRQHAALVWQTEQEQAALDAANAAVAAARFDVQQREAACRSDEATLAAARTRFEIESAERIRALDAREARAARSESAARTLDDRDAAMRVCPALPLSRFLWEQPVSRLLHLWLLHSCSIVHLKSSPGSVVNCCVKSMLPAFKQTKGLSSFFESKRPVRRRVAQRCVPTPDRRACVQEEAELLKEREAVVQRLHNEAEYARNEAEANLRSVKDESAAVSAKLEALREQRAAQMRECEERDTQLADRVQPHILLVVGDPLSCLCHVLLESSLDAYPLLGCQPKPGTGRCTLHLPVPRLGLWMCIALMP
jgi:hypothetical protein